MAYFTGTVKAKDLFSTLLNLITQVQAGESTTWWKNESSLASDSVFTSTGSSGTDRIVLILKEGTQGFFFTVGTARDYTPGATNVAGVFDNQSVQNVQYFTAVQNIETFVTYDLSVTKDRIIIHVQGDKLITQWQNTVMFLGMPYRYDSNDRKCVGMAASENNATATVFKMVENSVGTAQVNYNWYYVQSPDNPSWGSTYFLETLHVGIVGEGLRGELDGLYGMHVNGTVDGDEIDVQGVRYKVVQRKASGSNGFPRDCLVIRKN